MEEYIQRMRNLEELSETSTDDAHYFADELICEILESHGYHEVVSIFKRMHKWYS